MPNRRFLVCAWPAHSARLIYGYTIIHGIPWTRNLLLYPNRQMTPIRWNSRPNYVRDELISRPACKWRTKEEKKHEFRRESFWRMVCDELTKYLNKCVGTVTQHTDRECLISALSSVRNRHKSAEKFSFHQRGEPSDWMATRNRFLLEVVSGRNFSSSVLLFSDVKSVTNISFENNWLSHLVMGAVASSVNVVTSSLSSVSWAICCDRSK